MALNASIDLAEAFEDIDGLNADLRYLMSILREKVDDAVEETAEEYKQEVIAQIQASEIEEQTGELLSSWIVEPMGHAHYRVSSTAEHALYLEVGTTSHEITGNPLFFKPAPEKLDEYPDDVKRQGGFVEMQSVDHPGNKAYEYFEAARSSRPWQQVLDDKLEEAQNEALKEAGF